MKHHPNTHRSLKSSCRLRAVRRCRRERRCTAISSAMNTRMWHQRTREGEKKRKKERERGEAKNRKGNSEKGYKRRRITRGEGQEGLRYSRLSGLRRVRWAEVPGAPLITLTYDPINHRQIIHHLSRRGTKAGARSLVTGKGAHIRLHLYLPHRSFLPYTHDFPRSWKWVFTATF